jgi:hypothetical protein
MRRSTAAGTRSETRMAFFLESSKRKFGLRKETGKTCGMPAQKRRNRWVIVNGLSEGNSGDVTGHSTKKHAEFTKAECGRNRERSE